MLNPPTVTEKVLYVALWLLALAALILAKLVYGYSLNGLPVYQGF